MLNKISPWLFTFILTMSQFNGTWLYSSDQREIQVEIHSASTCSSHTSYGKEIGCFLYRGYLEVFYPETGNYILKGVMAIRGQDLEVTYENDSPNVPPQDRFRRYYLEPL